MLLMIPTLYLGLKILTCSCFQKCAKKAIRNVICNGLLRALIQTFLEITICAIVNILKPSFSSLGDFLSFALSLLLLPIYLLLPFKILQIVTSPDIKETKYSQKYGELYESLKTTKSTPSKFFFVIFCFHRLVFIFSIFAVSFSGFVQLVLMILATFAFTLYLLFYKPFKSGFDQCSTTFNSFFLTLLYSVCLLVHLLCDSFRELGGLLILASIIIVNGANVVAIIAVKIWECKYKSKKRTKHRGIIITKTTFKSKDMDLHQNDTRIFKEMPLCLATKRWRVRSISSRKSLLTNQLPKCPPQFQKTSPRQHWAYEASRAAKRKILEEKTLSFVQ